MRHIRILAPGVLLLTISACGTFEISVYNAPATPVADLADPSIAGPQPAVLDPAQLPLGLASSSEDIRLKLLRSSGFWTALWMDGIETRFEYGPESAALRSVRHQIWVEQSSHSFRLLKGMPSTPQTFVVSDGQHVTGLSLDTAESLTYSLPPSFFDPYVPPETVTDSITPHPMELQIASPFGSLVFPAGLAQRRGVYQPVAMEFHAGREALVVDWILLDGARPSRYWIDANIGVILRAQDFGKDGTGSMQSELVTRRILLDPVFRRELFDPKPKAIPEFSDEQGIPEQGAIDAATGLSDTDPLGAVYFFIVDPVPASVPRLVRLPGSCVVGLSACPALEAVSTPFKAPFRLDQGSLVWSPDGSRAAFVHQPGNGSQLAELLVFEPATDTWQWLARFPFIDHPAWSGDSQQIAFRVQDGTGRARVYAVVSEGGDPRVLIEPEPLPGGALAVEGWLGGEILVNSSFANGSGMAYAIDSDTAAARILFEMQGSRPQLIPSPDGRWLAYVVQPSDTEGSVLKILSPEGDVVHNLGTFTGSLHPIVWSSDAAYLALHAYGSGEGEVLAIAVGGSDLRKVFSGEAIAQLAFSPDGKHLLIAGGIDQRLVVVNLGSMEARLLRAPGLGLDTDWRLASWQPRRIHE